MNKLRKVCEIRLESKLLSKTECVCEIGARNGEVQGDRAKEIKTVCDLTKMMEK